jgi:predicted 2-oxoglutarate/Fe(II)-dependent dioxygenase YbiX
MHFDITKIKHLPNALTEKEVDSVYKAALSAPRLDAEVATFINGEYTKIKNSEYCNASLVDYKNFKDQIDNITNKCSLLIKEKFDLTCVDSEIEFVHYTTGTHYWPHADGQSIEGNVITRGNILRDITCVAYLNDDYEGGELNFQFFNLSFKPEKGTIIIYPSSWQYLHSVDTVIGERYAIVIWFQTTPHAYPLDDITVTDPAILRTLSQCKL